MNRSPVKSSAVKSIGHDPVTGQMEVEWPDGRTSTFHNVSQAKYAELISAKSIGKHLNTHFVGKPEHKA
jgi:hypothetical protein